MSCAASAAEKAADCHNAADPPSVWICFDAAAYSRKQKLVLVLCETSAGKLSPKVRFPLDLRGGAMRPSPLVPLVSSSSSPTLFLSSTVGVMLTAALLGSARIFPWWRLTNREKTESYPFSSSLWTPVSFGLINNSSPQSFRSLSSGPYASEPGVCWSKYACERQVQMVFFSFQSHIQFSLLEVTTSGLHEGISSVFLCFWVELLSTHKVRGFSWIASLCMY